MSVYQVRPAATGSAPADSATEPEARVGLSDDEISILTSWAEAIADAFAFAPGRLDDLRRHALGEAKWRAAFGLPEPSGQLTSAMQDMLSAVNAGADAGDTPLDLSATERLDRHPGRSGFQILTRRILRSILEQRRARQQSTSRQADARRSPP